MSKTEKELAFLRDLYIETDWTERFTNLFDENFKLTNAGKVLYINAGTGNHALALREKLNDDVEIFGVTENAETLTIARAKADAVDANVDFSKQMPAEKFDAVLADASFVEPHELKEFIVETVEFSDKQVFFFLPTASSFGEVFSLLWEALLNAGMEDKGAEVERLMKEVPTVSAVEAMLKDTGLRKIKTATKTEFFEFDSGKEFIESPLVHDFLLPIWFDFLDEDEKSPVAEKLAETIDADCDGMSFRFSIKASLISGVKTNE